MKKNFFLFCLMSETIIFNSLADVLKDHLEGTWIEAECYRHNLQELLGKFGLTESVETYFPLNVTSTQNVTKSRDNVRIVGRDPTGENFDLVFYFGKMNYGQSDFKPFGIGLSYLTSSYMQKLEVKITNISVPLNISRCIHDVHGCAFLRLTYTHVPSLTNGSFYYLKEKSCQVECGKKIHTHETFE